MKIEKINISEITEYENNAKLHPCEQIEQIKKSIQEFGNNDPIAIDKNNVIIEGHGRYKALQELGYDEVEVIRLSHMDDEQKRAYILAHNKLTMNSGFDIELLNSELESIVNIDMEDFGFDYYEPESEVEEDDFEVEETKEPIAKLGDIYQLGRHRLMCGDSTDPDQLAKLVDGQHFVNDRSLTTIIEDVEELNKMTKAELVEYIERMQANSPTTIINENKPTRNGLHPTMKPLKLIERLVRNSSKKGWNVLDSFNGSGSTMIVCEDLGRTYFGMELDPRYVDATIQRWEEHTGQTAVKLN